MIMPGHVGAPCSETQRMRRSAEGCYMQILVPATLLPVQVLPVGQWLLVLQPQTLLVVSQDWPRTLLAQSVSLAQPQRLLEAMHLAPQVSTAQSLSALHAHLDVSQARPKRDRAQSLAAAQPVQPWVLASQMGEVPRLQCPALRQATQAPLAAWQRGAEPRSQSLSVLHGFWHRLYLAPG